MGRRRTAVSVARPLQRAAVAMSDSGRSAVIVVALAKLPSADRNAIAAVAASWTCVRPCALSETKASQQKRIAWLSEGGHDPAPVLNSIESPQESAMRRSIQAAWCSPRVATAKPGGAAKERLPSFFRPWQRAEDSTGTGMKSGASNPRATLCPSCRSRMIWSASLSMSEEPTSELGSAPSTRAHAKFGVRPALQRVEPMSTA